MAANSDYFLERAAECARTAAAATLANVRDQFLQSEATWRAMADKLQKAEASRAQLDAEKAAQRAAQ